MIAQVTGINVLITLLSADQRTEGGIIVPGDSKEESRLMRGLVKAKGPGFLLPFPRQSDDLAALIESQPAPMYLPLEVEIGDVVYFSKGSLEAVMLDGQTYHLISYPSIKMYTRDPGT